MDKMDLQDKLVNLVPKVRRVKWAMQDQLEIRVLKDSLEILDPKVIKVVQVIQVSLDSRAIKELPVLTVKLDNQDLWEI